MKPISEVFHGDCMAFMAGLPDKSIGLAVVDPPYGIDASEMQMGLGKGKKASKKKNRKWVKKEWDACAPAPEYFTELFRVSKNQIIWGCNYFDLPVFNHYIIWDKEIPPGLSFSDCELAWTSFDGAQRMFRHSAYLDKKNKIHPTQKPVALYEWLLRNYAKPGDKILDTHLGSQSSRIAAYKLGFDFWGCEIDDDYIREGNARFEKEIAMPLFDAPKPALQSHLNFTAL